MGGIVVFAALSTDMYRKFAIVGWGFVLVLVLQKRKLGWIRGYLPTPVEYQSLDYSVYRVVCVSPPYPPPDDEPGERDEAVVRRELGACTKGFWSLAPVGGGYPQLTVRIASCDSRTRHASAWKPRTINMREDKARVLLGKRAGPAGRISHKDAIFSSFFPLPL